LKSSVLASVLTCQSPGLSGTRNSFKLSISLAGRSEPTQPEVPVTVPDGVRVRFYAVTASRIIMQHGLNNDPVTARLSLRRPRKLLQVLTRESAIRLCMRHFLTAERRGPAQTSGLPSLARAAGRLSSSSPPQPPPPPPWLRRPPPPPPTRRRRAPRMAALRYFLCFRRTAR
jgi:hypothetical protein